MNNNISFKHPAFTLAEVLITLLIISFMAIASTWAIPKKGMIKKKVHYQHASYACAYFGDQLYEYQAANNDLPPANQDVWTPIADGQCGANLKIPDDVEILSVYAIGGGGGGGTAKEAPSPRHQFNQVLSQDGSATVDRDGWYDLIVTNNLKGARSSYDDWLSQGLVCTGHLKRYADYGDPYRFVAQVYLHNGDAIVYSSEASNHTPNLQRCSMESAGPRFFSGTTGRTVSASVRLNNQVTSTKLVTVTAPQAGSFICDENKNQCSSYRDVTGANGARTFLNNNPPILMEVNNLLSSNQKQDNNSVEFATITVKWADRNDRNRTITRYYGSGGRAGSVASNIYPYMIKKKDIPEIQVGKGGTAEVDGGDTYFGQIRARGGSRGYVSADNGARSGVISPVPANGLDGISGESLAFYDTEYAGGEGGLLTTIMGGNGSGFGTGGGGGAVSEVMLGQGSGAVSQVMLGQGGRGAGGMLWIYW